MRSASAPRRPITMPDARCGCPPARGPGALDLDLGDAGPLHALGEQLADRDVLTDVGLVQLVGVPTALVVRRDSEAEAVRVDFLTHCRRPPGPCSGPRHRRAEPPGLMWLVRLLMRVARPCARGASASSSDSSSTWATETTRSPASRPSVVSALAMALSSTLYTVSALACGANCSRVRASSTGRPRTMSTTRRPSMRSARRGGREGARLVAEQRSRRALVRYAQ